MTLNSIDYIALILSIIGAINWGFVGVFDFNLVDTVLGFMPLLAQLTYIFIGLCGLYLIFVLVKFRAS